MKNLITSGLILLLPLVSFGQDTFYIGETLYIGPGTKLFTENHELVFGANIVTAISPKGYLVMGQNTSFTGETNSQKVAGYIIDRFPAGLHNYPVGSMSKLKPFELETVSDEFPVEIAYIASAPENPDDLEGVDEIADTGYWDISSEGSGKIRLYFTAEDLEFLSGEDINSFSIAGFSGSVWEIVPSTSNIDDGYIESNDFIGLAVYSSYTLAVSSDLSSGDPEAVTRIIVYCQNGTIFVTAGAARIQEVTLFDMSGKRVFRTTSVNAHKTAINGHALAKGVYIVNISTDKGMLTTKIVY